MFMLENEKFIDSEYDLNFVDSLIADGCRFDIEN